MPRPRSDWRYGLLISAGLVLYFLLMKLMGLVHVVELRVFNFFIMLAGLFRAFREYKETDLNRQFNYLRAFVFGISTAIIGSLIFALFLFIYLTYIDRALMESIVNHESFGNYLNPYVAAVIVAVEGIFSGILATFIIVNMKSASEIEDELKSKR
jgi:Protein of unknown function (DUF4199)